VSEPVPTVFLVDDDVAFLRAIDRLLRSSGYVTGCFSSPGDLLSALPGDARGCVLVDLHMPGMDGMAVQAALAKSRNPMPVVFLTGQGDIPTSVAAMRRGAIDFLVKTASREAVIAAVERALACDAADRACRDRDRQVRLRFDSLTQRERQVLSELMLGRLNKQIAAKLGIHERSVKRHRTHLMGKLGAKSVAELVQLAIQSGFEPDDARRARPTTD
jgi:FixJ family two-component response regulator